jgi:type I restriction enzyme S subunit
MTADLRPYPEYQDSGLPWLGQVPAHWEEKRAKYYFREVDERSTTGAEQLMSVSHKTGVTPRKANVTMFMAESNVGYKICRTGDLVINTMWAWMAAMGVARQTGLVSPSYGVYRPHMASPYVPDYVDHLLRTQPYVSEYICRSTGIRASRLRLYPEDFLDIPVVCPPREEQEVIVRFIAHHDRLVRRFIRNRRRLIEMLNEQKQAIINRAVTRGLDPNVPLKPSGIDWLGAIPEHWETSRLRNLVELRVSNVDKHSKAGELPVRLCNYTDVYKNSVITAEMPFMAATASRDEIAAFHIRVGDVIITKDSEDWQDIGVPAIVAQTADNLVCGYHLAILRPKVSLITGRFLAFAMQCRSAATQLNIAAKGVTRYGLSQGAIKSLGLAVPSLDEQKKIVLYIDEATASLNELLRRAKREIDLIREYRTRLIADVVTGKVDVRHLVSDILAKTASVAVHKPVDAGRAANIHFKRAVFAAEIVHRLHDEPTFGHVKFQKIVFLCEKQCGVETGSIYHRQAAGPYDNRALRSIDSQMKKQQWYAAQKVDKRYWYVPLAKAGGHKPYFDRYFADVEDEFTKVIEILRKADSEQSEIVATLYSAWENLLGSSEQVMEDRIIEEVLHRWHPSKQRIDEGRWRRALGWMKEKGLVPKITGSPETEDLECLEIDEYIDEEMPEDNDEVAEEVTDADD